MATTTTTKKRPQQSCVGTANNNTRQTLFSEPPTEINKNTQIVSDAWQQLIEEKESFTENNIHDDEWIFLLKVNMLSD